MKRSSKKGGLLVENVVFLVLNLVFLTILLLFVFLKTDTPAVLEEKYAKQIALAIDAAEPIMTIQLDMKDAIAAAIKNFGENNLDNMIKLDGNIVTVKLREQGGYSYSYFNDEDISGYLDEENSKYIINVNKK